MAKYDFSTLSSSDFEKLACDLLNADLPSSSRVKYKTFKDGRDSGIDFLYSIPSKEFNHIGQAKHYYRTGFGGLKSELENVELKKVKVLNPNKYILVTSVDLSVSQTRIIKTLFTPYIHSLNDVYGKKDLNRLLEAYPEVLSANFKLWFSDTTILQKVLHSGMYYRTVDFIKNELERRIRLFVETPILSKARTALEENSFVIITGEPGVGKSTVAEMLVYEYIKEDYELLHINFDINEVENFLRPDKSKQIIYFDDFLGSNKAEMNKAQGSETSLLSVVRRIIRYPNKRLIFTTRKHILNSAIDDSEKLARSKFKTDQTIFNLEEYDHTLKERLLDNHINEANIDKQLKDVLRDIEIVNFITKHKSFNPRSVEFITDPERIDSKNPIDYKNFIKESFNNPEEIWGHAYRKQIEDYERVLLNTLITFDEPVDIEVLEKAFNKRIDLNPLTNYPGNPFHTAIARLENGLIHIKRCKVDFQNHSLKDYIEKFLKTDPHELKRMMNSVQFVSQLSNQFLLWTISQSISIPTSIIEEMLIRPEFYIRKNNRDQDLINLATVIDNHISNDRKKEKALIDIINMVSDWKSLYEDYSLSRKFKLFLEKVVSNYKIQVALRERTSEIVDEMILRERDLVLAVELLEELKVKFDINFEDYNKKRLINHFEQLFNEHIDNEITWLLDFISDEHEAEDKKYEVEDLLRRMQSMSFFIDVNLNEFDIDWYEISIDNHIREQMSKDD
ncbi:hypothetical protein [Sphingobacterium sp.]|uniref:nSTAND3 domain-containing NTPase n=1 Tax=Sphingobacterium sp. TaxID=341027 RepID=UPI00289E4C2F|nr:hypothetical protein [Sphingobacterium sp.]